MEKELESIVKGIPKGEYCYEIVSIDETPEGIKIKTKSCPYWSINPDYPHQENGYCSLLERGDWEEGVSHLWDRVKECDINIDDD